LFSIFILDLWTDDIVAEYTGRMTFVDETYEIGRKLLLYYNAQCNYESNKKGIYSYFQKCNSLNLLTDTLDYLKDKNMQKESYGNTSKGTLSTAPIKNLYRRQIRDFLMKNINDGSTTIDDDGKVVADDVFKPALYRINYRALLKELASWSPDLNCDRHDALGMLMLLREAKLILYQGGTGEKEYNSKDKNYLGNDDFFSRNYDERFRKREQMDW
jgi:hypothetical protein